jgi:hypothetical protein
MRGCLLRHLLPFLGQPLCWFLAAGIGLYLAHGFLQGQGKPVLTLSEEELSYLSRIVQDEHDEAPTPQAMRLLAAERVRQLALIDAARRMGLDLGDLVIERRLMEKMRFVLGQQEPVPQPTEQELQAFLRAHQERYGQDGVVSFEQLFFAEQLPCNRAQQALLGLQAGQDVASDPFVLGRFAVAATSLVQQRFGAGFLQALRQAPLESWQGPVPSRYGCHLIRVSQRTPQVKPDLAAVREGVLLDWQAQAQQRSEQRALCRLLDSYRIMTPKRLTLRRDDLCPQQPF